MNGRAASEPSLAPSPAKAGYRVRRSAPDSRYTDVGSNDFQRDTVGTEQGDGAALRVHRLAGVPQDMVGHLGRAEHGTEGQVEGVDPGGAGRGSFRPAACGQLEGDEAGDENARGEVAGEIAPVGRGRHIERGWRLER
jgi:hypothetical protein